MGPHVCVGIQGMANVSNKITWTEVDFYFNSASYFGPIKRHTKLQKLR